jgi:serpin B
VKEFASANFMVSRNTAPAILFFLVLLGSFGFTECGPHEGISLGDQTKAIVAGNNAFALNLYRQIKTTNANLVFSPFSISDALAMTYVGARGNTEKQMARVLHWNTNQADSAFGELGRRFRDAQNRSGIEISTANGLWLPKGRSPLPAFLNVVRQQFDAEVAQFDFGKEPESARADINGWLNRKTRGRIQAMLPAGSLNSMTEMVLVNTVYFKGTWKSKLFDPRDSLSVDFHVNAERTVQNPMMFSHGYFLYSDHREPPFSCEVLELPYAGLGFSFVAILPRELDGLAELENNLTHTNLATLMASVQESDIAVALPKFTFKAEFSLENTLSAMGMSDAFDSKADFSGIDGTKLLFISWIQHQAFVELNEEGTTAAAATVSHLKTKGMRPCFQADHPFLFLIRHNSTGSILFMGRLVDPSK